MYTFPMICFPDLAFYKHFLQESTHFSSLAAQFPVGAPLSKMAMTAFLFFLVSAKHLSKQSGDEAEKGEERNVLLSPQTAPPYLKKIVAIAVFLEFTLGLPIYAPHLKADVSLVLDVNLRNLGH